jgi:hypothetical protein
MAYEISDEIISLRYCIAAITFGHEAVNDLLAQPPWRERFPDLATRAYSDDVPTMRGANDTILPGEFIYEVAGSDKLRNSFWIDSAGHVCGSERISAAERKRLGAPDRLPETQVILLEYGAYALFDAMDNLYGVKGQGDPMRDYSK